MSTTTWSGRGTLTAACEGVLVGDDLRGSVAVADGLGEGFGVAVWAGRRVLVGWLVAVTDGVGVRGGMNVHADSTNTIINAVFHLNMYLSGRMLASICCHYGRYPWN